MHNPKRLPANTKKNKFPRVNLLPYPITLRKRKWNSSWIPTTQQSNRMPPINLHLPLSNAGIIASNQCHTYRTEHTKVSLYDYLTSKFDPNTFKQNLLATIWPGSVGTSLYWSPPTPSNPEVSPMALVSQKLENSKRKHLNTKFPCWELSQQLQDLATCWGMTPFLEAASQSVNSNCQILLLLWSLVPKGLWSITH